MKRKPVKKAQLTPRKKMLFFGEAEAGSRADYARHTGKKARGVPLMRQYKSVMSGRYPDPPRVEIHSRTYRNGLWTPFSKFK